MSRHAWCKGYIYLSPKPLFRAGLNGTRGNDPAALRRTGAHRRLGHEMLGEHPFNWEFGTCTRGDVAVTMSTAGQMFSVKIYTQPQ
jgi:hypothetical protein